MPVEQPFSTRSDRSASADVTLEIEGAPSPVPITKSASSPAKQPPGSDLKPPPAVRAKSASFVLNIEEVDAKLLADRAAHDRAELTEQIEAQVSTDSRKRITRIMMFSAFIDLAGAVLLAPGYPTMASNAPESTPIPGPTEDDAFPSSEYPSWLTYVLAVNTFRMVTDLGGAFSNVFMGMLSDRVGRKPVILLCLMGGAVSYVMLFVAGYVCRSYIQRESNPQSPDPARPTCAAGD